MDIPTPLYSNVYAIADGTVRIAGSHAAYSDGVVQVTLLSVELELFYIYLPRLDSVNLPLLAKKSAL